MIKFSSNLLNRLKPDRVTKTPEKTIINDRLEIVNHLRELVESSWPGDNGSNPVKASILSFAKVLEKDIIDIG